MQLGRSSQSGIVALVVILDVILVVILVVSSEASSVSGNLRVLKDFPFKPEPSS